MSQVAKKRISQIHQLENSVKEDPKQVNGILELMKFLADSQMKEVRFSAVNALRRIFCMFLESGRMVIEKDSKGEDGGDGKKKKLREYKMWLKRQLTAYQNALCNFVESRDNDMMAPAIRTMLEFAQREWMVPSGKEAVGQKKGEKEIMTKKAHFGVEAYTSLLRALCFSENDVDIEVLLMMRNEIFDKADCRFYSWLILKKLLDEVKENSSLSSDSVSAFAQNALDILRVISYEDQESIDEGENLIDKDSSIDYRLNDGLDNVDSGSSDEEEDDEDDEDDDEGDGDRQAGKKRKVGKEGQSQSRKKRKDFRQMTRAEQVADEQSHKKVFSKAWLALLALPLSKPQHKLVLKHLPDHVIAFLANPLLLADYLTLSFEIGGVTSILALSSLFTLVVAHNLDYPDYFPSLYRLCTLENFSAKYRGKFMALLSASLRSVNLQGYAVAAFAKRLMRLALVVPSPSALFCIAQVTWLFRNHPQTLVLLHREKSGSGGSSSKKSQVGKLSRDQGSGGGGFFLDEYDPSEEASLEKCQALQSSLWEALGLEQHHLHSVATLAKSLEAPLSTENSVKAPFLRVDDFLGHTYESLMETELATAKKNSALAFRKPAALLPEGSVTATLFG